VWFFFVDGKDSITATNLWTLSKLNESDMTRYLVWCESISFFFKWKYIFCIF
jgi:hypothetical protein